MTLMLQSASDPLEGLTSKGFTITNTSNPARTGEYAQASNGTLYASGEALPIAGDYTWWYDASNPIVFTYYSYVSHWENTDDFERFTASTNSLGGYQGLMNFTNNLTIKQITSKFSTYRWNTASPIIIDGAANLEKLDAIGTNGGLEWGTTPFPNLTDIEMVAKTVSNLAGSADLTLAPNLETFYMATSGTTVKANEPVIFNINSPVSTVTFRYQSNFFQGNELELTLKSLSEAATNTNTTGGLLTFSYGNPTINAGTPSADYLTTLDGLGWDIIGVNGTWRD